MSRKDRACAPGRFWNRAQMRQLLAGTLREPCRWCGLPLVPRGTGFACPDCDRLDRMPGAEDGR